MLCVLKCVRSDWRIKLNLQQAHDSVIIMLLCAELINIIQWNFGEWKAFNVI